MSGNQYRSHKCCEINKQHVSKSIKLSGWVRKKRDHGTIIFIDLVDNSGSVQCIVQKSSPLFEKIDSLTLESVICVEGTVLERASETINKKITSGEVELEIYTIEVLTKAQELPFAIHQEDLNEELQLKYRFLYLRRQHMQETIKLRTQVIDLLRKYMKELNFQEIQTPILASSSPEGARDYLVPSRLHPGKFYALPQAPQQFKQILMASGIERYFQIAPCFRDEDSRADRLIGEFYQLDFEMAFASQEDVFEVLEHVLYNVFHTVRPEMKIEKKFPRIPYTQALARYGSDKPDLRNPLELVNVLEDLDIDIEIPNIFKDMVNGGGKLLAISAPIENGTRSFFDELQKFMIHKGAAGLAYATYDGEKWSGPMNRMFSDEIKNAILKKGEEKDKASPRSSGKNHNTIFLIADDKHNAYKLAGALRTHLGEILNLITNDEFAFCLITDFPMFEKTDDGKWDFMHNPFSMPQNMDAPTEEILSYQYDIVCNGYELSSGAVRNHKLELVEKVFNIVGDNCENLEERFPLYKAFKFGIPPHAGSAPGIDRIIMLLNKRIDNRELNVRDIVPFPLNQNGENLLMHAPSIVTQKHLNELGIKIVEPVGKGDKK